MVEVKRAFRSWLSAAIVGALVVGGVVGGSFGGNSKDASTAGPSKLVLEKKIFGIDEQPTMHLKASPRPVSWFGAGQAYAAEPVETEVQYDGHKIDAPLDVTRTGDGYTIKLRRTPDSKAGKYAVKAKWGDGPQESATQTFAWGVLSVNPTRSAYLPGETARIEMGVLSSSGHTLCAAPVTLTIYDPSGNKTMPAIHSSPLCKGDTYITEPDYYSTYTTGRAGHYRMVLRMADSDYALEASFEVKNALPFVVERTAPTRLFPPATYTNVIKVTAHQDVDGALVEQLPAGFTVAEARGAKIEGTKITWLAKMKAGESASFTYSFKAPNKSPAFYELSPLLIRSGQKTVYAEARSWQMAGDAVITFVQQAVTNVTSANTTQTSSVTATQPGSLLVLMLAMVTSSTSCGPQSITDSAGNTWTYSTTLGPQGTNNPQDPPSNLSTSSTFASEMAYTVNAASITSITVTFPGTCSQRFSFNLVEFTNVAKNSAVDTAASTYTPAPASPFTVSTPTITTTNENDLIIGMMSDRTSTMTLQGTSYTALTGMNSGGSLAEEAYQVVSTTGSYSMSWNQSAGQGSSSLIMAFMASDPTTSCSVGQISLVKQTVVNVTTATTVDSGRAMTSTAGNTLVMFYQVDNNLTKLSSVTDSASNTWTVAASGTNTNPPSYPSGSVTSGIAYALNAAAITSITVTIQASQRFSYTVVEFTNVASASAVDGSASAGSGTNQGTSITTPTITTTSDNDLVVASLGNSTATSTVTDANSSPNSGWTQLSQNTAGAGLGVTDAAYIIGPAGSYYANFTLSSAHSYSAGIIAFRAKPTLITQYKMMRGGSAFCKGAKSKYFWSS